MSFNFKRHNITYQILKRHKYVYKKIMIFICRIFLELCREILNKHTTTLFILFICFHIYEQHNYVSMCHYIISLNKLNYITYCMIFSL